MRTLAFIALLLLPSCAAFQATDVAPVANVAASKDAVNARIVAAFGRLLTAASDAGAPAASIQLYRDFLAQEVADYGKLAVAELAALAEMGDVGFDELLEAAEKVIEAGQRVIVTLEPSDDAPETAPENIVRPFQ